MTDLPDLDNLVKPVGHDGPHLPMSLRPTSGAPDPDPYPEHTKLGKVRERSQAVGEFLEWLQQEQGYVIAEYGDGARDTEDDYGHNPDRLYSVHRSIESWLAQFFQIDPVKIEMEKREMLARQRELNARLDAQAAARHE